MVGIEFCTTPNNPIQEPEPDLELLDHPHLRDVRALEMDSVGRMSRLLNLAGQPLPVDEIMRLGGPPQAGF